MLSELLTTGTGPCACESVTDLTVVAGALLGLAIVFFERMFT